MEEPEEPDWSAGSSDYPWVRSGYAYYIRVNRSANVVTVYTAGDDGRYSVPYPGHGVLLRRLRDAAGGLLAGRLVSLGVAGAGGRCVRSVLHADLRRLPVPLRPYTDAVQQGAPSSRGVRQSWEPAALTAVSACRWRTPSGSMTTSTTSPGDHLRQRRPPARWESPPPLYRRQRYPRLGPHGSRQRQSVEQACGCDTGTETRTGPRTEARTGARSGAGGRPLDTGRRHTA